MARPGRIAGVLLALFLACVSHAQPMGMHNPRIAIIIDDLGYHAQRGRSIINLPAAITCAVIPHAPHAIHLAEQASAKQKEVIIHLPMENTDFGRLDKGGLESSMSKAQFNTTVRDALVRIPQASGVNNHMGSLLTEKAEPMSWLMKELKLNHLYFIDSRTTAHSVAQNTAQRYGLPTAGRDIFLDNERDLNKINIQFNKLLRIARQRGHAIAIGHPYPETILYLEKALPLLEQANIDVVPVSRLLQPTGITTAKKEQVDPPRTGKKES